MAENSQDILVSVFDYTEYDIAYPVIITRWEVRQVNGLEKRYLQVHFQKINNNVKAFKLNVKCYSDFGEEEILDVSVQEIDKQGLEFSKVVPLNPIINKVELNITQCLSLDGSVFDKQEKQTVVNIFKPFNEEDKEAGERLLSGAAGYPADNGANWFCTCGTLNNGDELVCKSCKNNKNVVFESVTEENLQRENTHANSKKAKEQRYVVNGYACFLAFIMFITLAIPINNDGWYGKLTGFEFLGKHSWSVDGIGVLIRFVLWAYLIVSIIFIGLNIFSIFNDKFKSLRVANITAVVCAVSCFIYVALGFLSMIDTGSFPLSFISIIVNAPFLAVFFVYRKKIDRVIARIHKAFKF